MFIGVQATQAGVGAVFHRHRVERRVPPDVPSAGHYQRNGERGKRPVSKEKNPWVLSFVHRTGE